MIPDDFYREPQVDHRKFGGINVEEQDREDAAEWEDEKTEKTDLERGNCPVKNSG